MSLTEKLITDSLGFELKVVIEFCEQENLGKHKTYEVDGQVPADVEHTIRIRDDAEGADLIEAASHEVYHLFYSIRHLIACDEETEAQVFGQLVKKICSMKDRKVFYIDVRDLSKQESDSILKKWLRNEQKTEIDALNLSLDAFQYALTLGKQHKEVETSLPEAMQWVTSRAMEYLEKLSKTKGDTK